MMRRCLYFTAIFVLIGSPAYGSAEWFLMSREDGCVGLEILAKRERLPQPPSTPEEFAAMMRGRGYSVTTGLPDGFPPELSGKVVMVRVRENMATVFVREELCRNAER